MCLFCLSFKWIFLYTFSERKTQLQGETEADDKNVDIMVNEEADEFLIGRLMQMDFLRWHQIRLYARDMDINIFI